MSIAQLRRRLQFSVLGTGLLAGIVGCGSMDEPPVAGEAVPDDRGTALQPSAEQKARLQWMHDQVTLAFINQYRSGGWNWPSLDSDIVHAQKPDSTTNPHRKVPNEWDTTPRGGFKKEVEGLGSDCRLAPLLFRNVQLVGLLRPATPVVYKTDDVTMGTEMADVPTRPLDAFETRGLKKLKAGEDLSFEKLKTGQLRVLGPIYAGGMCIGCHSQPGEMLGAFSYTFDTGSPKP